MEKDKSLDELENLKRGEKEHIENRENALKALEQSRAGFEDQANKTHQAIMEVEMKETRLQVEKADLEQKLVVERLEKEQHSKNYLEQIQHAKTLEENLSKRKSASSWRSSSHC